MSLVPEDAEILVRVEPPSINIVTAANVGPPGEPGASGGEQLTVYNAAEQNFSGITVPTPSTPADRVDFTLDAPSMITVLAQFNAWANNDLVSYLYCDDAQVFNENGAPISRGNGAGSPAMIYLANFNGSAAFLQASGAQIAPKPLMGTGILMFLPAGPHNVELRYHSSSGAAARISARRLTVIGGS